MNVVNLRQGKENDLTSVSVVTDDIISAIPSNTKHFTMYVCFMEKTTINNPFMLLFVSKEKEKVLTRLDANFVLKNAHKMWEESDEDAPYHDRKEGESIRLDFYSSSHGISFSWTDIYATQPGSHPRPMEVRGLKKQSEMGLYLFLDLKSSSVRVLTDSAFGSFLTLRSKDELVTLECCVCSGTLLTEVTSWVNYECGHMMCEYCQNNSERKKSPQCCWNESIKTYNVTRVNIRHGPCVIDCCNKETKKGGVILVPCGCYIQCSYLLDAFEKHSRNLNPLIKDLQHCPYELCQKKIDSMVRGRHEQ